MRLPALRRPRIKPAIKARPAPTVCSFSRSPKTPKFPGPSWFGHAAIWRRSERTRYTQTVGGLLTDLYQLTMAAGYCAAGKSKEIATFELFFRKLPRYRNFVVAAGLAQAVDYLLNVRFTEDEVKYLESLPQFAHADACFFDALRSFRFTGDLFAM